MGQKMEIISKGVTNTRESFKISGVNHYDYLVEKRNNNDFVIKIKTKKKIIVINDFSGELDGAKFFAKDAEHHPVSVYINKNEDYVIVQKHVWSGGNIGMAYRVLPNGKSEFIYPGDMRIDDYLVNYYSIKMHKSINDISGQGRSFFVMSWSGSMVVCDIYSSSCRNSKLPRFINNSIFFRCRFDLLSNKVSNLHNVKPWN